MNRGILFIIGGLGLGNSTRCSAVIDHLKAQGWEIDVATSARGLSFFSETHQARHLVGLKQALYVGSKTSIGPVSVLLSAISFPVIGVLNFWRLFRLIRRLRPVAIVADSNYSLAPWVLKSCPLISLNNSTRVVLCSRKSTSIFPSCWAQYLIEVADSLFQRAVPDSVIAPWPEKADAGSGKILSIEPIAREQFRSAAGASSGVEKAVVLYSGSGVGLHFHDELMGLGLSVTVIGAQDENPRTLDSSEWVRGSDVVITSGGCSSISEALAAKKPMIVVPIQGHAEQNINALWIEKLGVGLRSEASDVREAVKRISGCYQDFLTAYERLDFSCNGGRQAANHINELAHSGLSK